MPDMKTAVFAGIGRLGVPVVENLVSQGWQAVISYRPGHASQKTVKKLIESTSLQRPPFGKTIAGKSEYHHLAWSRAGTTIK